MTLFTQIYDETHNFVDGNIEIANTLSNLGKAYLETLVTGLSDSLARPILLGFLYQIDVNAKRSRPYPIVSQRQTINLDLSECEKFLFIPSNRLIDDYILRLYVSTESGSGDSIDLSAYALKSELPVLDNYVSEAELATALSNYALVSQLPDLSSYVTGSNLDEILDEYLLISDLPSSTGSSQNFIAVSANATLESNKNYLATASGLTLVLPSTPAIGDVITIATGNFTAKVFQNTSQIILNNNTYTPSGSDTGIILKPYSSIRLWYCESGSWISGFRSRTINNWLPETLEPTASQKTYTPSFFNSVTPSYGTTIDMIKNGVINPTGSYTTNGLLVDQSLVQILVDFASPVRLTSFDFYGGQGNVSQGTANDDYKATAIEVYSGTTTDNLLGTFSPTNLNASQQNFTVDTSGVAYNQYLFSFSRSGNGIGIMELVLNGQGQVGGEILAV